MFRYTTLYISIGIQVARMSRVNWPDLMSKLFVARDHRLVIEDLKRDLRGPIHMSFSDVEYNPVVSLVKIMFLALCDIVELCRVSTFLVRKREYQILTLMFSAVMLLVFVISVGEPHLLLSPMSWIRYYIAVQIPVLAINATVAMIMISLGFVRDVAFWIRELICTNVVLILGPKDPFMYPIYFVADVLHAKALALLCIKLTGDFLYMFVGRHNCIFSLFWRLYDDIMAGRRYRQTQADAVVPPEPPALVKRSIRDIPEAENANEIDSQGFKRYSSPLLREAEKSTAST